MKPEFRILNQNPEFWILNSESSSLSPVHASRARRTSYMGCIQFIICHSRNPFPWSRPQPGPTHYEWLRNLHCSLGLAHQATTRLSCAVFSDEDSFEQRKQGIRRTITKQKRDCSSRRLCETLAVFLGAWPRAQRTTHPWPIAQRTTHPRGHSTTHNAQRGPTQWVIAQRTTHNGYACTESPRYDAILEIRDTTCELFE